MFTKQSVIEYVARKRHLTEALAFVEELLVVYHGDWHNWTKDCFDLEQLWSQLQSELAALSPEAEVQEKPMDNLTLTDPWAEITIKLNGTKQYPVGETTVCLLRYKEGMTIEEVRDHILESSALLMKEAKPKQQEKP